MVYNSPDSPFPDTVQIARWLQVTDDWKADDVERADGVRTLMRLKTGQPVAFEHAVGKGRVLTFLTVPDVAGATGPSRLPHRDMW